MSKRDRNSSDASATSGLSLDEQAHELNQGLLDRVHRAGTPALCVCLAASGGTPLPLLVVWSTRESSGWAPGRRAPPSDAARSDREARRSPQLCVAPWFVSLELV